MGVQTWAAVAVAVVVAGCAAPTPYEEHAPMAITVTSPAFAPGQPIPVRFTCRGQDVSPPISIAGVPQNARSLALVLDDPDAPRGTWTHWTAWNLPALTTTLREKADIAALGGTEGTTSNGSVGYHGPCPPSGVHRYFVRIYAVDTKLNLAQGASLSQLQSALVGHVLAQGQLMGTFTQG